MIVIVDLAVINILFDLMVIKKQLKKHFDLSDSNDLVIDSVIQIESIVNNRCIYLTVEDLLLHLRINFIT